MGKKIVVVLFVTLIIIAGALCIIFKSKKALPKTTEDPDKNDPLVPIIKNTGIYTGIIK